VGKVINKVANMEIQAAETRSKVDDLTYYSDGFDGKTLSRS
jgi:hypothetical protein